MKRKSQNYSSSREKLLGDGFPEAVLPGKELKDSRTTAAYPYEIGTTGKLNAYFDRQNVDCNEKNTRFNFNEKSATHMYGSEKERIVHICSVRV